MIISTHKSIIMNSMFRLAVPETLPRFLCARTMAREAGRTKLLNVETMNPNVRVMEYAVRGKVPLEAMKIKQELEQASVCKRKHVLLSI